MKTEKIQIRKIVESVGSFRTLTDTPMKAVASFKISLILSRLSKYL